MLGLKVVSGINKMFGIWNEKSDIYISYDDDFIFM
jgi:hypothetical protein